MSFSNQRLFDLVRQMRFELHNADLITNDEYSELAKEHSAVARLESYDQVRAQISELTRQLAEKDRTAQLQIDASIEIQDIYENKILQLESELIQDKETIRLLSNSDVARSIAAGVEDIAAGRVTPLEKVRAELAGRHDWCANCEALKTQLAEATERADSNFAACERIKRKWEATCAENKRLQLELDAARKDTER